MKKNNFLILFFLFIKNIYSIPLYFCTTANSLYFVRLLNLIGSIHDTNFSNLEEIAIFNLGLSDAEITKLKKIKKVKIYEIKKTHPDLLKVFVTSPGGKTVPGWYAWKPVVIKQSLELFPYVLYIDAGSTVLRPLDKLFEYIIQEGYFVGTIGNQFDGVNYKHPVGWGTTEYQKKLFDLDNPDRNWILRQESLAANVIGMARTGTGAFLDEWYELSKNLNNFKDDGTAPNGFGTGRHDQTLLSIIGYLNNVTIYKEDYTQKNFTYITVNGVKEPFYITWNPDFVCEKTHIYNSREDLKKISYYLKKIRYKKRGK